MPNGSRSFCIISAANLSLLEYIPAIADLVACFYFNTDEEAHFGGLSSIILLI